VIEQPFKLPPAGQGAPVGGSRIDNDPESRHR
jgi:hypothetical protein